MKIEVWSDYLCPFCYIGKRRLEQALEQFPHRDKVQLIFRSFELNPDAPVETNQNMEQLLAQKYGITLEQAKANNDQLALQAKTVGLDFRFETYIPTNSFDAHRLTHFAAVHGKEQAMSERLFQSVFTDSGNIGDRGYLADLAKEIGLNGEEAAAALAEGRYGDNVRAEEKEGETLGIRGVPFYVFNRKYAVSGAQSSEVFLNALNKAWEDENPLVLVHEETSGGICTDEACKLPEE
ncbi:DsbA family oxidoreductase [Gorillibacterium massiliense]|uniref:DsbA family oxidoreductase n=1 Tax=Gorillibacterium massiliense TaxID=1280390 RepID=UPI0004AE9874|nr:DsbA family oxidoreductase [Gorillibacterium massiliense]